MSKQLPSMLAAWGKAMPDEAAPASWHPLAYHCLDVAAVTAELLAQRPVTRARAAKLLGLDETSACTLLVAFSALHDIGKLTAAFQAKAEPKGWTWPSYLQVPRSHKHKSTGHTSDGILLWDARMAETFLQCYSLTSRNAWREVAAAVFGHHGRPTQTSALLTENNIDLIFCPGAQEAAMQWVSGVVNLLPMSSVPDPQPKARRLKVASWWVAGLITLSDWIGSNTAYFPYTAPDTGDTDFAAYWARARERAVVAVRELGLIPPVPAAELDYAGLTSLAVPTALQTEVQRIRLHDGPMLAIMEDATGSGKTEAAQMLVHRLLGAQQVSGAFWAMPTQATANAMYGRQGKLLAKLFSDEPKNRPSLVLTHGRASLHTVFTKTVLPVVSSSDVNYEAHEIEDSELPAEVACSAFFADSGRKALLADVGVGTVDQAFLGVLPTRFNTLRLFAMAEKVLVLDEVHAFDEYMRAEAYGLLQMQALLGGSVVLLSATLPAAQRKKLVEVWQDALVDRSTSATPLGEGASSEVPYPLLTVVSGNNAEPSQHTFETSPRSRRTVPVRWLRTFKECLHHVLKAHKTTACVVWIRNTVGGCLEAAAALRAHHVDPIVFHSRFTPADRQGIEAEVLKRFGPESRRDDRRARVLVATQVVEQSLDLDFDVMVSDIAPIDLLIQRAGRLQRHKRPADERPDECLPELVVLAQSTDRKPDATWVSQLQSKTEYVYGDLGLLWRTVRQLEAKGGIEVPGSLRSLIEGAYGSNDVPEALVRATDRSTARGYADGAVGRQNVLTPEQGYGADGGRWSSDVHYPTRLGDSPLVIRLARVTEQGVLQPMSGSSDEPAWRNWVMSEIRLRRSQIVKSDGDEIMCVDKYRLAVERVRSEWPLFERDAPLVPMELGQDDVWEGSLQIGRASAEVRLQYSKHLGLELRSG